MDILYGVALIFLVIGYFLGEDEQWVDAAICSVSACILLGVHALIKKRRDSQSQSTFSFEPQQQMETQPVAQPQFAPPTIPSVSVQPAVKVCPYCQTENSAMSVQCQMCLSNLTG